ncbi:DUF2326 domain-containing protein [Providencia sp. PROV169]|uniref:DUF2326 domain-containing protein n=1 Tax=Providencia sp. PROV169 TaxID=2949875 RepID=UPI00234B32EA|nr:DUF2326 domain-containing protein [Providencia sp. PROV169]
MLIINKLYSNPALFDPIEFNKGLNIILGEKVDGSLKTNGVGKSLCVEFINYALLKDHNDSRVSKIPLDVLPQDFEICLDFTINNNEITIKRNVLKQDYPELYVNGIKKPIEKKDKVLDYLASLLFSDCVDIEHPSFRAILGPLIRDEKSEFKSIIKCFDTDKRIPPNYEPHLYLLGINPIPYNKAKKMSKDLDKIKSAKSKLKENIELLTGKKISEAKADLNNLKSQLEKIQNDIEQFENIEGYEVIKDEIIALENKIEDQKIKLTIFKTELSKINMFHGDNYIDDDEIVELYNQFKDGLGDLIKKELDQVTAFKKKIDEFQFTLIGKKRESLHDEIEKVNLELISLNKIYKEKIKLLDQDGLLKNIKVSIAVQQKKFEELSSLSSFLNAYDDSESERKLIDIERKNEIHILDLYVHEKSENIHLIESLILKMHDYVYGNQQCSFNIEIKNNKEIVNFDLRIYDDGSHSIDREKVFFYDYSLLTSIATYNTHPKLLIHDNIFEVDQHTIISNLNYINDNMSDISDKQYILTINRDVLINQPSIELNIEEYICASFTKNNRFLRVNYQETS